MSAGLGLRRARAGRQVIAGLALFAGVALLTVGLTLLADGGADSFGSPATGPLDIVRRAAYLLVVVGPAEEVIFRGYLLERLRELTGPAVAVVGQAVAFGLWHYPVAQDWAQVAGTGAIGLVYGLARVRVRDCTTGSTALAHGLHDTTLLLLATLLR